MITNYKQAREYLKAGRNPHDRPVAKNTRLQTRPDGSIAVKFHATDVVTYHSDGSTSIAHGGWKTRTTEDRIHAFSPYRVKAGELKTSWSNYREFVRRGPENWIVARPDGTTFELWE